jgi:hypothetical protein
VTPTKRKQLDEAWAEAWVRKKESERLMQEALRREQQARMEALLRVSKNETKK